MNRITHVGDGVSADRRRGARRFLAAVLFLALIGAFARIMTYADHNEHIAQHYARPVSFFFSC